MPSHTEDAARDRLLAAAGEVFAEEGYESATIRGICTRAGANVAAVNYHFRDKLGLYTAVVRQLMEPPDAEGPVPSSVPPEEALRAFISAMVRRLCLDTDGRSHRSLRIMVHEMARPSAGLEVMVGQLVQPRYNVLRGIISGIINLPPDHDIVRLSAHSIIGQIVHYVHGRPVLVRVWPGMRFTPEQVDQIANHISEFSLAGLRNIAGATTYE